MAIRTNTNPRQMDLQPEMRTLLMRNGMQAHIVSTGSGYQLAVQGHDSPLLTYPITEKQMLALTDWGTNTANRKAYNIFTSIVGNDFYMPKDFVHARNANGRVAMGLHGYRIGIGEYGRVGRMGMPPPFLGWTPRNQWGFHLRRVGGQLFYPGPSIVPERPDGRMKPGELQSGGYGFYYKGHGQQMQAQGHGITPQTDVLEQLQLVITPATTLPRSQEPAKKYGELITSPVYFSNEKWQECLSSHGIIVDAEARTLTVQSESSRVDMRYDLSDEEVGILTSNDIKAAPVERRLEVLNNIIKDDFADSVTREMLDSVQRIDIALHPEVRQDLDERVQKEREILQPLEAQQAQERTLAADGRGLAVIDGKDLTYENGSKGWYKEGAHGREVQVDEIFVHPGESEDKYRMTAVIDGQVVSHEITQKQYDKFMAVDDYHRMKLFSKIFTEVDMKSRPEARAGLGTRIFAALAAGAVATSEVVHNLGHHHHGPEFYGEHFGGPPRPYFKPGVDSPMDVAARNFEAQMNAIASDMRMGR